MTGSSRREISAWDALVLWARIIWRSRSGAGRGALLVLLLALSVPVAAGDITVNKEIPLGAPTPTAGQVVTFDIKVENNTGVDQLNVVVTDPLAAVFFVPSITVTQISETNTALSGSVVVYSPNGTNPATATISTFKAGAEIKFRVNARLNSNASGSQSNTATVTGGYPGSTQNFGVTTAPPPVVSITKTPASTPFVLSPATPATFTVTVKNTSATDAVGYSFRDIIFAGAASSSGATVQVPSVNFNVTSGVVCAAIGASPACPTLSPLTSPATISSGFTLFNSGTTTIPAGANWTFTYTLTPTGIVGGCGYDSASYNNRALLYQGGSQIGSAISQSGNLAQAAAGGCIVFTPEFIDVGVTKSGVLSTIAGIPTMTYTMTVTNYSGKDLSNKVNVYDSLSVSGAGLVGTLDRSGWALSCSPAANCPTFTQPTSVVPINGQPDILNSKVLNSFPANATVTFTLIAPIKLPIACGPASVTVDNQFYIGAANGYTLYPMINGHKDAASATQQALTIPQKPCVDIVAEKSITNTSFKPGDPITFAITLYNVGTTTAPNVPFEDLLPSGFVYTSSTCTANGTASCGASPVYTTSPSKVTLNVASLPAGGSKANGSVTITINGTASTLPTDFGAKRNEITIPISPANGAYLDIRGLSNTTSVNFNVRGKAELSVTKTGSCGVVHAANGAATYVVTVKNNGPDAAINAILKDPAVANLSITGLTCASSASPAGVCPTGTTAGQIALMQGAGLPIPSLANGATATFTLTGAYGATSALVNNTAIVALPTDAYEPETTLGNNSASCESATLTAPLTISKIIAGAEAGTQGAVIINATCGSTNYGPWTLAANSPAGTYPIFTIPNLPVGATCTVRETQTGVLSGSTVSTTYTTTSTGAAVNNGASASVVVTEGAVPSNVTFTDTYPQAVGNLVITKTIAGAAAGQQGAVIVNAVCGGVTYGPYTLSAGATGTTTMATISNIPRGVICNVAETSNGGNANLSTVTSYVVSYVNAAGSSGAGGNASVPTLINQTGAVALTNTYQNLPGSLTIQKIVAGDAAGQQGSIQFGVKCGATIYGPYTIAASAIGTLAVTTVNNLPGGVACAVTETPSADPLGVTSATTASVNGGAAVNTLATSAVIAAGATQQITYTNTYAKDMIVVVNGDVDVGNGTCNPQEIVLTGTRVDFVPASGGLTISTATDINGIFSVNLAPGIYTMTTTPTTSGISPSVQTIIIPPGGTFNVSAVLTGSPCGVPALDLRSMLMLLILVSGVGLALLRRNVTFTSNGK
jgi:uncharacterized repeat protein (TIGR01451 family)